MRRRSDAWVFNFCHSRNRSGMSFKIVPTFVKVISSIKTGVLFLDWVKDYGERTFILDFS